MLASSRGIANQIVKSRSRINVDQIDINLLHRQQELAYF